jgi:hypothetical protein
MMYRMFPLVALAVSLLIGASALAAATAANTHDGKLVSATIEKLVMTGLDGTEHSHGLTTDAKLTLDGKSCLAEDLKNGMRIRVTVNDDIKPLVTKIEALDKQADFEARN